MQTPTEYGSWEEWARRINELKSEGRPGVIGAKCSAKCTARKDGCLDCTEAYVDWLAMNHNPNRVEVTHKELGRGIAGLPQNTKNPA